MTTQTATKYAVWKYELPISTMIGGSFELEIPQYGRILALKTQRGKPTLWVLVNTENGKVVRKFELVGTGHPVSLDAFNGKHIGSILVDNDLLVFHLFERAVCFH